MVGPTVRSGNFRVVEVGSEESNYFIFFNILFYFIFFNNTILIKFRYKKKRKSRYGKDDVARKTHWISVVLKTIKTRHLTTIKSAEFIRFQWMYQSCRISTISACTNIVSYQCSCDEWRNDAESVRKSYEPLKYRKSHWISAESVGSEIPDVLLCNGKN